MISDTLRAHDASFEALNNAFTKFFFEKVGKEAEALKSATFSPQGQESVMT